MAALEAATYCGKLFTRMRGVMVGSSPAMEARAF
jgi:hypothetical protein